MEPQTPRQRRLQADYESLKQLAATSSAFQFEVSYRGDFDLPESYILTFLGPSLVRIDNPYEYGVRVHEKHQVRVTLGQHYPRHMPSLQWITPIFHPNIASSGAVCLGGYSSFWVPSLKLDQLCEMLWDMLTFRNYNLESPYHRDAALWMTQQTTFSFPLASTPLRKSAARLGDASSLVGEDIGTEEIRFLDDGTE